jgi:hypothetical protein
MYKITIAAAILALLGLGIAETLMHEEVSRALARAEGFADPAIAVDSAPPTATATVTDKLSGAN